MVQWEEIIKIGFMAFLFEVIFVSVIVLDGILSSTCLHHTPFKLALVLCLMHHKSVTYLQLENESKISGLVGNAHQLQGALTTDC